MPTPPALPRCVANAPARTRRAAGSALLAVVVMATVLAACGSPGSRGPMSAEPQPGPKVGGEALVKIGQGVKLTLVGEYGSSVTDIASRKGDRRVFVAQRNGLISVVARPVGADGLVVPRAVPHPYLDLSSDVSADRGGLLSLTFDPDGSRLLVSYIDRKGDLRLRSYPIDRGQVGAADPDDLLDIANRDLTVDGRLRYGPDGKLYVSVASGSDAQGRRDAQDPGTLPGGLLRLAPNPDSPKGYDVPLGNPFRYAGARPENWAVGLMRSGGYTFDSQSGDLWVVTQDPRGDRLLKISQESGGGRGRNLGQGFDASAELSRVAPGGTVAPLVGGVVVRENAGCGARTGVAYRGSALPGLWGAFIYADQCTGAITAIASDKTFVLDRELLIVGTSSLLTALAAGPDGEIYVGQADGGLFRMDPAGVPDLGAPNPTVSVPNLEAAPPPPSSAPAVVATASTTTSLPTLLLPDPASITQFCGYSNEITSLTSLGVSPGPDEAVNVEKAIKIIDRYVELAPAELTADVLRMRDVFADILSALREANYQATDPRVLVILSSIIGGKGNYGDLTTRLAHTREWERDNC